MQYWVMSVAAYGIWELVLGVRVTIELFKTKKVWKSDKYKQKTVVSLCDFLFYLKKETGNKVHLPNGKKKNCFHQFWAKHDKRIFIHFTYIESTHFKCGKRVPLTSWKKRFIASIREVFTIQRWKLHVCKKDYNHRIIIRKYKSR